MIQRFSIEFIVATVAAVLAVAAIAAIPSDDLIFEWFLWRSVAFSMAVAVAQWLVLRRYVPWAQWWAHATLFGEFAIAMIVTQLMNLGVVPTDGAPRAQIVIALASGLAVALAQFPTLYGRVADAWLWPVAAGFAHLMVSAISQVVFSARTEIETDIETDLVILGTMAIQMAITLAVQAATLAWLLRKALVEPAATDRPGHTRVEFVIAWAAVPVTAYTIAQVAELSFIAMGSLPILFVAVLAGGQLWVLSHVAVDQRRWRLITLASAVAVIIAFGLLGGWSDFSGTRARTLGLLGLIAGLATGVMLLLQMPPAQPAPTAVEPSSN